jgi:hypothetical protein
MTGNELVNALSSIEEITVNLLLTRRCNYECAMCMYASSPRMPKDEFRGEDLYAVKEFIDAITMVLRPETGISVKLVGGEPTLNMDHFAWVLDTVSRWERPLPDGADWVNGISVEATTNGWWLESAESTAAFARATHRIFAHDGLSMRISNSAYHDEFRHERIRRLFQADSRPPSYGKRQPSKLEDFLEEMLSEQWEEDEDGNFVEHRDAWMINELRKAAGDCLLYIDSKMEGPNKISPVGRAKTNGIGIQDGYCHPTAEAKFTFMPTKEGERPGRLYDPCCNGGKVPLGFADEGVDLLLKRILFIQTLHDTHPLPEKRWSNPGQGSRCAACPSFGAKWLKQENLVVANKLAEAKALMAEREEKAA